MPKHFIKPKKEKVICQKCGQEFMGGAYVDHCPFCLWSLHVDDEIPGDRKSQCFGLMKPIGIEVRKREKIMIIYSCQKCGKRNVNKIADNDDFEKVIQLSAKSRHDKHEN